MRSNIQFDWLTRMHYHAIKDVIKFYLYMIFLYSTYNINRKTYLVR